MYFYYPTVPFLKWCIANSQIAGAGLFLLLSVIAFIIVGKIGRASATRKTYDPTDEIYKN